MEGLKLRPTQADSTTGTIATKDHKAASETMMLLWIKHMQSEADMGNAISLKDEVKLMELHVQPPQKTQKTQNAKKTQNAQNVESSSHVLHTHGFDVISKVDF